MICDRIIGILKRFCLKMIGHDTATPILEIILESPGGPVVVSKICVQSQMSVMYGFMIMLQYDISYISYTVYIYIYVHKHLHTYTCIIYTYIYIYIYINGVCVYIYTHTAYNFGCLRIHDIPFSERPQKGLGFARLEFPEPAPAHRAPGESHGFALVVAEDDWGGATRSLEASNGWHSYGKWMKMAHLYTYSWFTVFKDGDFQ